MWEPVASRLVNQGLAKRVATGAAFDENDAGFLVMSKELIDKRPDVVDAYLKAELEAQQWVANPDNAMELARMAVNQTEGYTVEDMWDSMFEQTGDGNDVSNRMPFIIDDQVQELIKNSWSFLNQVKVIPEPQPIDGIVQDDIARKVLADTGAKFPIEVKALPKSDFKK